MPQDASLVLLLSCVGITAVFYLLLRTNHEPVIVKIPAHFDEEFERFDTGPAVPSDCQGSIIGVDLGTVYARVAVYRNNTPIIIPNEYGSLRTPAYIAFNEEGEPVVGDEAKMYLSQQPERVVFDVVRFIGRKFKDIFIQSQQTFYPFEFTSNSGGGLMLRVKVGHQKISLAPEELLALLLRKLKKSAESYLKRTINCAIISVPAFSLQSHRLAMKDVGMIAGVNIKRMPNTPSISALGFMGSTQWKETNILAYYLGGGACEVSLMTVSTSGVQVYATTGTRDLGYEDFIHALMTHFFTLLKKSGHFIGGSEKSVQKLRREIERAILEFYIGGRSSTNIKVADNGQTLFDSELTRKQVDKICEEIVGETFTYIRRMQREADELEVEVKDIVLLGGGVKMFGIKHTLISRFPKLNVIDGESGLGDSTVLGTSLHAAVLQHQTSSPLLLDVSTYAIGLFLSGRNATVINKFTPLPFKKTKLYGTAEDNQENVATTFYEGDNPRPGENVMIYEFVVDGLKSGESGIGRVEVEYELTGDGLLQVYGSEINNINTVQRMKPKNMLPNEDMNQVFRRQDDFARKGDIYTSRQKWMHLLSKCVYGSLHIISRISEEHEPNLKTVEAVLRGELKWLDRSGTVDPVNFEDRKKHLTIKLKNLAKRKTYKQAMKFC